MAPLVLVILALPVYLLLWRSGPYPQSDSPSYLHLAQELRAGGLSEMPLRTPGYPLFLLLTGNAEEPTAGLIAAQLLLFLVAVLAAARLLRRLGARDSLVIGFVAVSVLPHVAQPASQVLPGSLTQSLLTLGLVCFGHAVLGRSRWLLVASGSLLGACALVRPEYLPVPFLLGAIHLGGRRLALSELRQRAPGALALVLPAILLVLPLAGYTQARFGVSSSRLLTLSLALRTGYYIDYLPAEYAAGREILLKHRDAELVEDRHHRVRGYIHRAWPELVSHFGGDPIAARRWLLAASIEVVKREPRAMLLEVGRSLPLHWEWVLFDPPGIRSRTVASTLLLLHYATVLLFWLAAAGAAVTALVSVRNPGGRSPTRLLGLAPGCERVLLASLGVVLLNMLIQSALTIGVPRYRLPTELLILFAAFFFLEGLARARSRLRGDSQPLDS